MSTRKSVNGRPTGTDGSDFPYRMVVDSRYKKVARGRSHLSTVIFTQAIIQFLAALVLFQTTPKGVTLDNFSIFSAVVNFISLLVEEIGRKRSRVSLLKSYLFGSSVATLIPVVCLLKSQKSFEDSCYKYMLSGQQLPLFTIWLLPREPLDGFFWISTRGRLLSTCLYI